MRRQSISYTVWIDAAMPDLDDHSGAEVLSSVLLGALNDAGITVNRFVVEIEIEQPETPTNGG